MGMDSIDYKNRHRYFCPDCQEELNPESEAWSIARVEDKGQLCEECQELENANNEAARLSSEVLVWAI